jgi:hypothetical protein
MRTFKVFGLRYLNGCAHSEPCARLRLEHIPTIDQLSNHIGKEKEGTTLLIHWVEQLDDGSDHVHPYSRCVWDGYNLHPY